MHASAALRIFGALRKTLPLFVCAETRMKLREGLFLIPDVAVFWPSPPALIPDSSPLIAIEILHREHRAWGVAYV
jgi:hypothetical protein